MGSRRSNNEGTVYYRSDRKRWCAEVRVGINLDGSPIRKTISALTEKELINKKKKLEAEVVVGSYVPTDKTNLESFLTSWLEDTYKSTVKASTYFRNHNSIKNHVFPTLGKTPLQKLTPMQLQGLYKKMLDGGLSSRTIRNLHFTLHKALKQAVRWEMLQKNVADLVELPRIVGTEMSVLNQEQVKIFLEAAKDDHYFPFYLLAITSGLREGELVGLRHEDVNLETGSVTVKRTVKELNGQLLIGTPKSKAGYRTVNIPQLTVGVLKAHKEAQKQSGLDAKGFMFTDSKGNLIRVQNMIRRSFKPLLKKAGLPDIRVHDLRHSFATLLLEQGVNIKTIQYLLGHSNVSLTLGTYSHFTAGMQQQAANELDRLFNNQQQQQQEVNS